MVRGAAGYFCFFARFFRSLGSTGRTVRRFFGPVFLYFAEVAGDGSNLGIDASYLAAQFCYLAAQLLKLAIGILLQGSLFFLDFSGLDIFFLNPCFKLQQARLDLFELICQFRLGAALVFHGGDRVLHFRDFCIRGAEPHVKAPDIFFRSALHE